MKANVGAMLALALSAQTMVLAQQRETPPVRLAPVAANIYEVLEGQGARGGAYIGSDAVVLIDAKMDKNSVDQTIAEVRKLTDKPIRYLINTHSDGDHVQGNQFFPPGVIIVAHENCRNEFFHPGRDGAPSEWSKPELAPFIPGITFRDKMDLYVGPKKIELRYFGTGHTTGDAVVYFPDDRIAFVGDMVFLTRPQLIHTYKGGNSLEHVRTLQKMLDTLDAEKFCGGHEEVFDRASIRAHIEQMRKMQARIEALMKEGKDLETIRKEFKDNEARLVEAVYLDLKKARGQ